MRKKLEKIIKSVKEHKVRAIIAVILWTIVLGFNIGLCVQIDWSEPMDPNARAIQKIYNEEHKEQAEEDDGKMLFHNTFH